MAKQFGAIKYLGNVGDLSFRKTKNGFSVNERSLKVGRSASDPDKNRIREAKQNFTTAAAGGRVLREALKAYKKTNMDKGVSNRLLQMLVRALRTDHVSPKGEKKIELSDPTTLTGFDFNALGRMKLRFPVNVDGTIDETSGVFALSIPPFVTKDQLSVPVQVTHFRVRLIALQVDFSTGEYTIGSEDSDMVPIKNALSSLVDLNVTLQANSPRMQIMILAWNCFEKDGLSYTLSEDKSVSGMTIMQVK